VKRRIRWAAWCAAMSVLLVTVVSTAVTANAAGGARLETWLARDAVPLRLADVSAPVDDLEPLARPVGDARIVGLGESVHGAAEEMLLKARTVRYLVERKGFRSIAWEDDWTTGLRINEYLRSGVGDPTALARQMGFAWQFQEARDLLVWLRQFNRGRVDKVHFVGLEYYATDRRAYDLVDRYVAATAPRRLDRIRAHLRPLWPTSANIYEYIGTYRAVADKAPYLAHAHALYDLVAGLPVGGDERQHQTIVRTVRQIVSFYEHFSLTDAEALVYREAHAADNLRWWSALTGDRIVYWAATAHTAKARTMRIVTPPDADMRFASVGSYLRHWYGDAYRSIGFTFDHGQVSLGGDGSAVMPPPEAGWFERPLGAVALPQFAVDLHRHWPAPVRQWLGTPIQTRGLADRGPESFMDGGTAAEWFDIVVHCQVISPAHAL
jgi:erythromycin esterase-like protein